MKLPGYFNAFLANTVNLKDNKLSALSTSVDALYEAIAEDAVLGPFVKGMDPQGSWAHETIINPRPGREFDADFMLCLNEQDEWSASPSRYLTEVRNALGRHGTYKAMVQPPKCRCVRVMYAGDYHVDIVPFLTIDGSREVIINGDEDDWEDTDPDGFTQWMKSKTSATNGHLKRVLRLLKYVRDHREHFTRTRSVILTAIVGERVDETKAIADPSYYGDLPTAFYHLVRDLNDWLAVNPTRPSIVDPSGATDPNGNPITFDHRWTDDDYVNFAAKIKALRDDVRAAYEENDQARSVELWQRVFGDKFDIPKTGGSGLATGELAGSGAAALHTPRGG